MPEQQMTALAGDPMPVEFCHAGSWYTGLLLGWRHGSDLTCWLRVQFVIGGLRRTGWMQLSDVRLPAPQRQPAPATPPVPPPRRTEVARSRV